MFTNGTDYELDRKLKSLKDHEINLLDRETKMALMRDEVRKQLHVAHERSAASYNKRAREVKFHAGQEVYRRNLALSSFGTNFNAIFARKYIKCRIRTLVGNNMHETEALEGKPCGIYHAKDLKQ
ncbi:uncharacterized protein [Drosophila tropicalis]|uniref:uncharacterized protein n=1 Tax=Drosophila tropicalis TaxID=46794 RepID=UPI0035ABF7C0